MQSLHFGGEPEGETAAAVVKPVDRWPVQVFPHDPLDSRADAGIHNVAIGIDALFHPAPGQVQHGPVAGFQPAPPQSPGQGVPNHGGGGKFSVGTGEVQDLWEDPALQLDSAQGFQVTQVGFQQFLPAGMPIRQVGQRLGESQGREPVAAAPEERYGPGVPEQAVFLLHGRVCQEGSQQVRIPFLSGQPKGPPQDGGGHEHILHAKVWIS